MVGCVGWGEGEEGMANLFDVDGAGERGFLGIVALKLEVDALGSGTLDKIS